MGLGPRGGTLASPTQSPAPPALRERVGQDDHGPTPLRANSHSTTRHAVTAHSDAQPHAPTRRLVYAPTPPSLVVFRLQPLGAGWEGENGEGDRGRQAVLASGLGGLPAGVGTTAAGSGIPHPPEGRMLPIGGNGPSWPRVDVEGEPGTRAVPELAWGLEGRSIRERIWLPRVWGHTRNTIYLGWGPQCSHHKSRRDLDV